MNRRDALKSLAMLPAVKAVDGEVATLSPKNPQAFVITTPNRLSWEQTDNLREQWKAAWKGSEYATLPVLIMQEGMQLSVVDQGIAE